MKKAPGEGGRVKAGHAKAGRVEVGHEGALLADGAKLNLEEARGYSALGQY